MDNKRLMLINPLIRYLCRYHDALIVGNGARYLLYEIEDRPKDYDVMVPACEWPRVSHLIRKGTPANSFGGFKINDEKYGELDLWAMDVVDFFANIPSGAPMIGYNPDKNLIIRAERP